MSCFFYFYEKISGMEISKKVFAGNLKERIGVALFLVSLVFTDFRARGRFKNYYSCRDIAKHDSTAQFQQKQKWP